jgi:multiple sugar transport system permease protein
MKQAISVERAAPSDRRGRRRREWVLPLAFVLPSLLIQALVILYPFANGLYLSLTDSSLLATGSFVGLDSFHTVVTGPLFWGALWFTGLFALGGVAGSYVVGLLLALLLNTSVPARGFFRAVLLIPWVIPPIVSIVSWRWMLDQSGLINTVLAALGATPVYFLSSIWWARVVVIVVKIWVSFPFMMVTCLATLQSIPQELYEAAAIDGSGPWALFRFVTMPHLRMITIISCLLMTIWSVNDFATIWLLTQGGPVYATQTLITLAYTYAFQEGNIGLGAATAVIMLVLMLIEGVILLRILRVQEEA